jgi:hypothetical protein
MQALAQRQSIDDALGLWAQAETLHEPVVSDVFGTVLLLYRADPITLEGNYAIDPCDSAKKLAAKIQGELRDWAAKTGASSAEALLNQLPSLASFKNTGHLGNLRKEWQAMRQQQSHELKHLCQQRKNAFAEVRGLLPALPLTFKADGSAVLRYAFNTADDQPKLLDQLQQCMRYSMGKDGLYRGFHADLKRIHFEFVEHGRFSSFDSACAEQKLLALSQMLNHDPVALATLSRVLHQGAIAIVKELTRQAFPTKQIDRMPLLRDEHGSAAPITIRLQKEGDSTLRVEVNSYAKASQICVPANAEQRQDQVWRINQGPRWSGEPGPRNFTEHHRIVLPLDLAALSQARLQPAPDHPIQALVECRICLVCPP